MIIFSISMSISNNFTSIINFIHFINSNIIIHKFHLIYLNFSIFFKFLNESISFAFYRSSILLNYKAYLFQFYYFKH